MFFSDISQYCLMVILLPLKGMVTLWLSSYRKPKSENPVYQKTQIGRQSLGLASNFASADCEQLHKMILLLKLKGSSFYV